VFVTILFYRRGREIAGPCPAELQQELVFSGCRICDTNDLLLQWRSIDYLTSPAAQLSQAKGMTRPKK